jgi:hypothetical protein
MSNDDVIDWPGKSGRTYRYWFSTFTDTFKDEGGNYMFVKPHPNGGYLPVYIGVADSLRDRLSNHERMADAKRAGATYVMTHTTPAGDAARLAEEKDLIAYWQPVLNTHHRSQTG